MAWPCISRVCCLARFWNQLDKSDLSVPLTIQNYSEIADQEVRSVTKQVPTLDADLRGSPRAQIDGPGTRGSSRARKEPSYKPREDYHPPEVPFPSVTQYKQDFKPWPIPRKENFPWISNGGGGRADGAPDSAQSGSQSRAQAGEERARLGQRWGGQEVVEERRTSSYRQEYRPWTGVRPAKSTRRNPPGQYSSPGTQASRAPCETSYQAAYSGEAQRPVALHEGENAIPTASDNIQPIPAEALQASLSSSGPQLSVGGSTKGEEHLVRTKLPPNPSAVFQSGPRVLDI
ncbi:hypothetical protein fugu_013988 [Takifugu bimaculatus]|uniref:MAP6 domain-containing protein 1 n=1 Tax=Takifugu bimaculatus TaxID=433685 RepID=A0A4Z2C0H3_9TELE|nr:hypothetical protein fugu_013988 [Takifugu bimaculatus]